MAHSAAMQYQAHTMPTTTMAQHGGLVGSAGPGPSIGASLSWHQPSSNYTTDLAGARQSWDFSNYIDAGQAQMNATPLRYERMPSINQPTGYNGGYYLPNGSLPNGSLPLGSLPNGSLPNGGLPNGSLPNGNQQDYKEYEPRSTHHT